MCLRLIVLRLCSCCFGLIFLLRLLTQAVVDGLTSQVGAEADILYSCRYCKRSLLLGSIDLCFFFCHNFQFPPPFPVALRRVVFFYSRSGTTSTPLTTPPPSSA